MHIFEGDKVRLRTGEMAWVSEVLGKGDVYIVEVIQKNGNARIAQIERASIVAKLVEIEQPLSA